MASLRDNNDNTMRRAYKRSRITRIGGFVDTETEEFNEELTHRNNLNMFMFNNDNTDNKQDDHDVAVFLEQSEDDDDPVLLQNNQYKIDNMQKRLIDIFMNHRITDCIEYIIAVLAWYCDTCRLAGVIKCALNPSYRFQTRAIRDHILSSVHYKHSSEPVKRLIDEYKKRIKRMLLLCNLLLHRHTV